MNPTLPFFASRMHALFATRAGAIRKVALADREAGPPARGELPQGQKTLMQACTEPSGNLPYYTAPTLLAAVLAVVAGAGCYAVATDPEPGTWSTAVASTLAAVAVLSLYQAVARRFGPTLIDGARYAQARTSLHASGDEHAKPISIPLMAALTLFFMIDGTFSGYSITTQVFASMFTPRIALVASLAWSAATAWLLWHLTMSAARESAINARRGLVRKLLASPRSADRQRGEAMIEHVGQALGNDYSTGANRIRARLVLALVVLGLTMATFVVRVSDESADFSVEPMPAVMSDSAPEGFTN